MMTGEVIEELAETVIKQEFPEEKMPGSLRADEIQTAVKVLKWEIDCFGTEQYFNSSSSEIQENDYKGEGKQDSYVMKVEQNEDSENETTQNETDNTNDCKNSPVQCKEEIDIKYEDLETELTEQSTDWRGNSENGGKERRKKAELHKRAGGSEIVKSGVDLAKSEVALYKCHECLFAAKISGNLKKHMLIHKSKSEVALYKCHECSYASRISGNLNSHMLIHKAESEVVLYKCHECSYASRVAGNLKKHMLVHFEKSEVDLHKCKTCLFTTKYAQSLRKHMKRHYFI